MSDSLHTLRARAGGHALHSKYDSTRLSQPARDKFMGRFPREVIAAAEAKGEILDEAEIARRAEHARKAYFTKLAYLSAKVRQARAGGKR